MDEYAIICEYRSISHSSLSVRRHFSHMISFHSPSELEEVIVTTSPLLVNRVFHVDSCNHHDLTPLALFNFLS